MTVLRGHRQRQLVTTGIVGAALAAFTWSWVEAPRVSADPAVQAKLASLPEGELWLGEAFEGLPLVRLRPLVYSTCAGERPPGAPPCHWVRVAEGRVAASDPKLASRARAQLRPVGRR